MIERDVCIADVVDEGSKRENERGINANLSLWFTKSKYAKFWK